MFSSQDVGMAGTVQTTVTLRNPNQRHKIEYKALRKQLEEMKHDRSKLKKKRIKDQEPRKEITRQMKQLEQDFKERCEKEMAEFRAMKAKQEEEKNPTPAQTSSSSATAMSDATEAVSAGQSMAMA